MEKNIIAVNGIQIYYEKTGNGAPLLLLHGNGEDHTKFGDLPRRLASRFTIYAPDSRDHGRSSRVETLNYLTMAEDMAAFIRALSLDSVIICGFSDGGIISLLLAYSHPELIRKQIICGANTRPEGLKLRSRLMMRLEYFFTRDKKLALMLTQPDITPEMLASIQTPTLVLAGSRDLIYTSHTKALSSHLPCANLMILKGETHDSYITNPSRLLQAVHKYLKKPEK